jgi:leader peptidase (prepilin peptidase)/N-methyltransferase
MLGDPLLDAIFASIFGLVIGSFLNVCIYRLPRDLSVVAPRSFCPGCGRQISWYDNIPLLSYVLLRGKCRECHSSFSARYPIVEALTAVSFFSAVRQYGTTGEALRLCIFSCLLLVLFFTDLETYILPDEVTIGGMFAGLFLSLAFPKPGGLISLVLPVDRLPAGESFADAVLGALIPAIALWLVGELYFRFRGREGLGFGDVKMMLMLGSFTGLEGSLLSLIAGSVAGSLVGVALLILRGRSAATQELPFGSFLAAGALILAHLGITGRLY